MNRASTSSSSKIHENQPLLFQRMSSVRKYITPTWNSVVLLLLVLAAVGNQMNRFIFPFLSSVSPRGCDQECKHVEFIPVCMNCTSSQQCIICSECKRAHHFDHYNMQDGSCITKEEYGLLAGLTFASVYALASLFAGHAVDRHPRLHIIRLSMVVWVIAGAGQSQSKSFLHLLGLRMLLGISEAFLNPAAYSLIAAMFPHGRRATANAVYSWGVYCGYGAASLSIPVALGYGWRMTCVWFNTPLVICLLLLCFLRDPTISNQQDNFESNNDQKHVSNGNQTSNASTTQHLSPSHSMSDFDSSLSPSNESATSSFLEQSSSPVHLKISPSPVPTLRQIESLVLRKETSLCFWFTSLVADALELLKIPIFRTVLVGTCLRYSAGYTLGEYLPIYFHRMYPESQTEFAVANAIVVVLVGIVSSFLGGVMSDVLSHRFAAAPGLVVALSFTLAVPSIFGVMVLADKFWIAFLCWGLSVFFGEVWFGPIVAVIQTVVPLNKRGLGVALFSSCSLVGNIAPAIVGLVDPGNEKISHVLAMTVCGAYGSSAIVFAVLAYQLSCRSQTQARCSGFQQ
eukprot:c12295_g1_i5.p1 GENE.c12295_g1_i5~~c12295_g1_i5.p1  ORF type:complete len:570 (-),score=106.17 c12295_g1_i5:87-1796(-)